MDVNSVLFDMLVVLLAAKIAAEVATRIRVPVVIAEIVAGVIVGPSALGIVETNDVLRTLAELGVILLLVEVGTEMDLRELAKVGRAALAVALVGVAVPFATGYVAGLGLSMEGNEALFVAAALTATSVGITARVFGELRALASVEARTVLGAAVADDVIGLLILTVVARIATGGNVSAGSVAVTALVAIGFLVVATAGSLLVVPWALKTVARVSRSNSTLLAVTLAFVLALAELANAAKLAPIIGAFVAGLAIAQSPPAERIRREFAPLHHIFVPVFFLQIGIDAELKVFTDPEALKIAGVLLVVAVVGKLASAAGLLGAPGDRLTVGIGMLPRGEVGLIFATIGLRAHVFGEDVYGALLIVVFVTTVVTPPLLRMRYARVRAKAALDDPGADADAAHSDEERAAAMFAEYLHTGDARSWRAFAATGALDVAFPEISEWLTADSEFPTLERLQQFEDATPDTCALAAFALDITSSPQAAAGLVARTAERLEWPADSRALSRRLASDGDLLVAAARGTHALDEQLRHELTVHLASEPYLRALTTLTAARIDVDAGAELDRLDALVEELARDLSTADDPLEQRRQRLSARLAGAARDRLSQMFDTHFTTHDDDTIVRHVERTTGALHRHEVRAWVDPLPDELLRVEFVARDAVGLLAREARALHAAGCDIREARVTTFADGVSLGSFVVQPSGPVDADALADWTSTRLPAPVSWDTVADAALDFDDASRPLTTRVTVTAADRTGLLASIAAAFSAAGITIHSATIHGRGGEMVIDHFDVTDSRGAKLDSRARHRLSRALREGKAPVRLRPF